MTDTPDFVQDPNDCRRWVPKDTPEEYDDATVRQIKAEQYQGDKAAQEFDAEQERMNTADDLDVLESMVQEWSNSRMDVLCLIARCRRAEAELAEVKEELRCGNSLYAKQTDRMRNLETELAEMKKDRLAAEKPLVEMIDRFLKWESAMIHSAAKARPEARELCDEARALLAQRRKDA